MLLGRTDPSPDIWAFRAHPAVWVLMVGVIGGYWYMTSRLAPAAGYEVTTKQRWSFAVGIGLIWLVSDWPMHDLSDSYLYSAHMLQHMVLSYFAPPLLLLATPTWMARLLIGERRVKQIFDFFTKPVVAAVLFNGCIMVTHVPVVVNTATTNLPVHYSLHLALVVLSLLMWIPVCGPLPEKRLAAGPTMMYLFAQSVIPTVPAGWLTFAEGAVYKTYDHNVRVWGLTVTNDQQIAGAVMKVGGSMFLWAIMTTVFFKRFMGGFAKQVRFQTLVTTPATMRVIGDETLTFEAVQASFERTAAVPDPSG